MIKRPGEVTLFKMKLARVVATGIAAALVGTALTLGAAPAATAAELIPGVAPIEQRNEQTVTADVLPTVQLDSGIVWAQVMNGNVVYAGGSFSQTRPAGAAPATNLTPRSNILAYDVRTGALLPFAPQINGTVKSLALSPDGSTLYVGGSFTKIGTTTRYNVAAFSTATGELSATFKPAIGGSYVNAIVATSSAVYFGGLIGAAGGQLRKNFAAANVAGQVLAWAPTSDLQVDSMVLAPGGGKLIAAGRFARVNDVTQRGLAALSLQDGALLPWTITGIVKNGRNDGTGNSGKAGIWAITADDTNVYGTGWVFADVPTGNLEGLFAADGVTGDEVWIADCHGDHYGVFSDGTNVYSTGHEHECTTAGGLPQGNGTMRNATVYTAAAKGTLTRSPFVNSIYADWSGHPAPAAVNWFPDWLTGTASGMGQAAWTVTGNDEYVVFGGEFVGVNNQGQQGLVRFARDPQPSASQGPRLSGSAWTPTARSLIGGTADVLISSNWDRDDRDLTYELWEQGAATPAATTQGASTFWNTPQIRLTATGLAPGSSHTYTVTARDGNGNSVSSAEATVTVTNQVPSPYAAQVFTDSPTFYWRFGSDNPKSDWVGSTNAVTQSGFGTSTASPIAGESGSATFNGSSNGVASTSKTVATTSEYSVELWFKAANNASGKLIGYGSAQSGNSSSYDRHVYLANDGRLIYGNYPGSTRTIATETGHSYRDGQWHHAVATQGAGGMALYVDGQLRAVDTTTTGAEGGILGYWRVGGDNLGSWPDQPSNYYFNGSIDEVAVYGSVLTAQQVSTHYAIGVGAQPPTAAFTVDGSDLERTFDASTSEAGGTSTLVDFSWGFGDGTPSVEGISAAHTFAEAGTYTVTLTITDSLGITDSLSIPVTVTAPHVAPVAVITNAMDGLTVALDASSSVLSGGATLEGATWDLGDGTTSDQLSLSHVYAATGTYEVALTVRDSEGVDSAPVATSITVTHADPVAAFETTSSAMTVDVDASGSFASDGAEFSYQWDWGDGSDVGTAVTATHVYAEPGDYTITLTIEDAFGAGATTQRDVRVDDALVRDSFEREVASGWGSPDVGDSWAGTTGLSVSGGVGQLTVSRSRTRAVTLNNLSATSFDASFIVATDKVADGGGLHLNVGGRKGDGDEYRAKLRISASGVITVNIAELVDGTETLIATSRLASIVHMADAPLAVRFVVDDTPAGAVLKAKVWPATAEQPAGWTVTATSSTAALQDAGTFAIGTYASGSVTNGPVVVRVDDLTITGAEAGLGHTVPTAVIGAEADGLSAAFSGESSVVFDGATTTAYEWDFGDGVTSTEAAPVHTYAAAGTYSVTLVVTDSAGARSAITSQDVTVEHAAPTAEFVASIAERSVSVDAAGSHASDNATITQYVWSWGDGSPDELGANASHTYAEGGSYQVALTVTDSLGGTSTVTRTVGVSSETFAVQDAFERDVASGWGSAVVGGGWDGTTGLSVSGGVGSVSVGRSQTRNVTLASVSLGDIDAQFVFAVDRVTDGGGLHLNVATHKTDEGSYRAKLRMSSTGVLNVGVAKLVGTAETLVANRALPAFNYAAGQQLMVRLNTVTVDDTTTMSVKVWPASEPEPTAWSVVGSDSEAALQAPGAFGFSMYASGSSTNGPTLISIDDLTIK